MIKITDNGIKAMATTCPLLEYLNISSCCNLSGKSLGFLIDAKQQPKIKIFKMKKLFRITTQDLCNFIDSEFSFSLKKFIYHECLVDEHMIAKYISPIKNCLI